MKIIDPFMLDLEITQISGQEAICLCPFHSDSKPSSSFNFVENIFFCFSCNTSANARKIAAQTGGIVEYVENMHGISSKAQKLKGSDMEWQNFKYLRNAYSNPYLKSRGVQDWQIEKHSIKATKSMVLFPMHDAKGELTGYQARNTSKRTFQRYRYFGKKQA